MEDMASVSNENFIKSEDYPKTPKIVCISHILPLNSVSLYPQSQILTKYYHIPIEIVFSI